MDKIEYASVNQVLANPIYPFTKGQIQNYLLHRHKNGLDKAVRKIGKRIFLRLDLFNAWIEQHAKGR